MFVALSQNTGGSSTGAQSPSFAFDGQTTIIPRSSGGFNTPTFTRATTAYVFGYGPTAVLGVDSPIAILCGSGEARFMGARRISANSWSAVDANGVPLTTVTPYTDAGGPYGYLAEGARADVLGTTDAIRRTMAAVGWTNGGTMTVAAATGIDGVASAGARLTGGAVAATNTLLYTPGLGAADRTYSAWIKRITGTGAIGITADGTNYTDISAQLNTSTAAHVQIDAGSVVPIVGIKITTNGDVIDVDFNTLEAATFANPTPIPLNVSKAADVLTYASAGNIASSGKSSIYFEVTPGTAPFTSTLFQVDDGSSNNRIIPYINGTAFNSFVATGGVSQADVTVGVLASGTTAKLASIFDTNNVNGFKDGVAGTADTTVTLPSGLTTIRIGVSAANDQQPFASIRNLRIYPTALPASKLQAMTT